MGILALKTESDRSSTQEMSLICTNTQMLSDGDFTVELDYKGNDEVGVLTGSFRKMRDSLQRYIDDLNSRAYKDALTGVRNKASLNTYLGSLNDIINRREDIPRFAVLLQDRDYDRRYELYADFENFAERINSETKKPW